MKRSGRVAIVTTLFLVVAIATALPAGATFTVAPGGAQGSPTECANQQGQGKISPGLGNHGKPQVIVLKVSIFGCSHAGKGVTSGKGSLTITDKFANCKTFAVAGSKATLNESITWNTNDKSVLKGIFISGPKKNQATMKFQIVSGSGKGHIAQTIVSIAVTPPTGSSCSDATPAVHASVTGIGTLSFS